MFSKRSFVTLTVSISSLTVTFFRSLMISCKTYSQSMQPGFLGPRTEIEAGSRRSAGNACNPAKLLVRIALLSSWPTRKSVFTSISVGLAGIILVASISSGWILKNDEGSYIETAKWWLKNSFNKVRGLFSTFDSLGLPTEEEQRVSIRQASCGSNSFKTNE